MILSPCVNECTPNDKVCKGCGRSDSERAEWASFSDEEKYHIIEVIRLKRMLERWERERD